MNYPEPIKQLIYYFSMLPSVGPKTAERYVFYLLRQKSDELQKFAQALAELKEKTKVCRQCFAVTATDPCSICRDPEREKNILNIVANTREILAIEMSEAYNGQYFVLGGVINAIENIKPKNLRINALLKRIKTGNIKEVIFSLSPTIEGETTVIYLTKLLKPFNIKITRLARGLPTGADVEYADPQTLKNALKNRKKIN